MLQTSGPSENSSFLVASLRQVPFMRNLPLVYRQALASICQAQHYSVGEVVIPQGSITDHFYIVAEGRVHFRRTDQQGLWRSVGDAGPGQHFGLPMFTSQALSEYKAEALTDTTLYVMDRQGFDRLVEAQPNILRAMGPIYHRRLELTRGFNWLTPGEDVIITTHRHWFALVESLLVPIAALGLLVGIGVIVSLLGLLPGLDVPLLLAIPGLVLLAWVAYSVNDYVDDDFIVTNKRVAHIERVFLKKELRYQIPNDKIQSITVKNVGAIASALKISDLEVRSAGRADSRILFDRVARAERIRQLIMEQRGNLRARDEAEMRRRFRARVEKDLEPYIMHEAPIEGDQELPRPRRRRSWGDSFSGMWRSMFGRKMVDGSTITYRKHWIALARQAGRGILFFVVVMAALLVYLTIPTLHFLPSSPTLAALAFLVAAAVAYLAWQWADWRNDIYQLTSSQIIDVERLPFGLFSRSTEALLSNVQDARALRPSAINSLLNFGNVEVQTAGGGPPLTFYDVPSPEDIVEEIFRRMEAHRVRILDHQMLVLGQQVTDALITYDHMKEKSSTLAAGTAELAQSPFEIAQSQASGESSLNLPGQPGGALGDGKDNMPLPPNAITTVPRGPVTEEFFSIPDAEDEAAE